MVAGDGEKAEAELLRYLSDAERELLDVYTGMPAPPADEAP